MLSSFILAAAETHAASGGLVETFGNLANTFGVELKYVIIQTVSFLILFGVLYRFGIKPTISAMDERRAKIDAGLKYAEEMKAQLAAAQQESSNLLKNAQVEATKIIEESRKTAKDFSDKAQKEATERANGLITKAQQAIELEHKKMLSEARTEIARLVVSTTERVLAKKLSDADRAGFNEAAAKELTSA